MPALRTQAISPLPSVFFPNRHIPDSPDFESPAANEGEVSQLQALRKVTMSARVGTIAARSTCRPAQLAARGVIH